MLSAILWETAVAYAGYCFGLCVNFTDCGACIAEVHTMPKTTVLAVHYAWNVLTTSLANLQAATNLWEPDYRHVENYTLGCCNL